MQPFINIKCIVPETNGRQRERKTKQYVNYAKNNNNNHFRLKSTIFESDIDLVQSQRLWWREFNIIFPKMLIKLQSILIECRFSRTNLNLTVENFVDYCINGYIFVWMINSSCNRKSTFPNGVGNSARKMALKYCLFFCLFLTVMKKKTEPWHRSP